VPRVIYLTPIPAKIWACGQRVNTKG